MADYTTIDNPGLFFNTVLYTGNGSTNAITGVGYQPDWVWIKRRGSTGSHRLFDSVRGVHKSISSNSTGAELDNSNTLTSFDTDGFSLASDSGNYGVNVNGDTQIAWNWLGANGSASNSDGSITSTISANPTAGFCICSWTGDGSDATIGHGLGAVPKMIIHKHRSGSVQWNVYHVGTGTGGYLRLDGTNAFSSNSGFFGTAPTSSVFSPGSHSYMSGNGNDNIAYIFAEVQGYSKFGSYTGNGNADGIFVYTGFKPAFIIIKRTDTTAEWHMIDNKRNTFNTVNNVLSPNTTGAEATTSSNPIDFTSQGFKCRGTGTQVNASGGSFIYMAFAEHPFVTAGTKAAGTAR